ncbi:MAG: ATP-grasp domain-containing protein [Pyrinomonadaceae bacterium]
MRVALLYNARPAQTVLNVPDDAFEEYDSEEIVGNIADALRQLGVEVEPVLADVELPWRLRAGRYDFAFNIAEGEGRRCREAVPVAVCELLGIPNTGSDALTLAITLDKFIARRVVSPDVPVARGVLMETEADETELRALKFPVIVKPNDEGSSKGIRENPIAHSVAEAWERYGWLRAQYGCPVLVEQFLQGTEITVGIIGNGPDTRVLGMMEIAPASFEENFVYSVEVKRDWQKRVRYHVPPRVEAETIGKLQSLALKAYRLLGCRDIARIDFRLDAEGQPYFLECNPLPGLNPESGDIVILSRSELPYEKLVQSILLNAAQRVGARVP